MMPRLTQAQGRDLRRMVQTEETARNIAEHIGVSLGTVANYRRSCKTLAAMPASIQSEIRRLAVTGASSPQIASRLLLSIEDVRDFRRVSQCRSLLDGHSKCSKCGAMILPKPDHSILNERGKIRGHVSRDHTRLMADVIVDLLQLNDLRLITSPLFYHLAQRAEKVYEKIHKKEA